MALLDAEIQRIRYELGYNVLTSSAEPYVSYVSIFTQIVQQYASTGASTTSSTAVTAATTATPVTLTLASGTGFSSGCRVVVDVDDRQEVVTAQGISGASLVVQLTKTHSGTYPVTVEGGESIIREILANIRSVRSEMAQTFGTGSLKKVDEIEFYDTRRTAFGNLGSQLRFWRDELASAIGVQSVWAMRGSGSTRLAAY